MLSHSRPMFCYIILTSVFVKMVSLNAEFFKVTINYSSTDTQKYARKRIHHEFEERIDKSITQVSV